MSMEVRTEDLDFIRKIAFIVIGWLLFFLAASVFLILFPDMFRAMF